MTPAERALLLAVARVLRDGVRLKEARLLHDLIEAVEAEATAEEAVPYATQRRTGILFSKGGRP